MSQESYKKINVYFKDTPQKIIGILKDLPKNQTIDIVRQKIKKMGENDLFYNKQNEYFDKYLESDVTLDEIVFEDNGNFKIFLEKSAKTEEGSIKEDLKEITPISSESQIPQIQDAKKGEENQISSNISEEQNDNLKKNNINEESQENLGAENNQENSERKESKEGTQIPKNKEMNENQETQSEQPKDENPESIEKIDDKKNLQIKDSKGVHNDCVQESISGEQGKNKIEESKINHEDHEEKNLEDTIPENQASIQKEEDKKKNEKKEDEELKKQSEINSDEGKNDSNTDKKDIKKKEENEIIEDIPKENNNEINGQNNPNLTKIEKYNKKDNNYNTNITNNTINLNPNTKKENNTIYKNPKYWKNKSYFFYAIINDEYYNKFYFTFQTLSGKQLPTSIKYFINDFMDTSTSFMYVIPKKLKRKLIFYEVDLPQDINPFIIVLHLQKDKNEKEYLFNAQAGNNSNLYTIDLNPYIGNKDVEKNIFFDLQKEEEKQELFSCLINFFKEKEIHCKKKFIENFLKNKVIKPKKNIYDIFSLVKIFGNNFLDINFYPVFKEIEIFKYENKLDFNNDMKETIFKLFFDIKNFPNKDEIREEIWCLAILFMMKIKDKEKILSLLSFLEKLKNKDNIIRLLFSRIENLIINIIPEIKEYFIDIIKYKPDELNFMIMHINNHSEYLNLILKNIKEIKGYIYQIFPQKFRDSIKNDEETYTK